MVEWRRFPMRPETAHLDLGWDLALAAIDRSAADPDALRTPPDDAPVASLLPPEAAPYFAAERIRPGGGEVERAPSFAVLVVVGGAGTLRTERGDELPLSRGATALVPHAGGATVLVGELDVMRCLPPAPDAAH
jgi:mannose-6-phosphate isomerase